jgi:hypothetical protein
VILVIVRLESVRVEYLVLGGKGLNKFPASDDHIREIVREQVFGCISIMLLQGVIQSRRHIRLAYDIHSCITTRQMRGKGKI